MKIQRRFAALWVVGILSLGVLLAACGSEAGTTGTGTTAGTGTGTGAAGATNNDSAARQQFLADRSGTPDPNATAIPGGAAGNGRFGGNRAPGVFGTVKAIDGNKITIASMVDSTEGVMQVSDTTTVSKEATGTTADIKTGETVTAIGAMEGDTVTAQRVQIGGGFGGFGGRAGGFPGGGVNGRGVYTGTRAFPSGTPPAGFDPSGNGGPAFTGTPGAGANGGRGNFGGNFVTGTVEKVEGNVVTVKTADGTTSTFTLTADTAIMTQVTMKVSDIAVGNSVSATGTQNGDVFDATAIQLIEGVQGQQTPTP